jgi:phosphoribosylamine--glycine ligase
MTNGGRVIGLSMYGKNRDEARNNTYQWLPKVKFEGMQFRNDIAK